jgi:hypothetical protein
MPVDANFIRKFASETYVQPARQRGEERFSISVKPVEFDLRKKGLPAGRTPLVCSALRGNKFQQENRIVLDRWDGPPSGQSPTVVYHFRFIDPPAVGGRPLDETPEEWAERLTSKIRGLMKEKIAEHGGTEGYIRWVRSSDDEEQS